MSPLIVTLSLKLKIEVLSHYQVYLLNQIKSYLAIYYE